MKPLWWILAILRRGGITFCLPALTLVLSTGCHTTSDRNRLKASEPGLRAGAAIVDIAPTQFPVIVNAMFTERSATNLVDPLEVRALVLDDGATRLAIAVIDSCMVPRDLLDDAKARASRTTGIPTHRMLVSSTHTHSAPSAMGCLGSRVDPRYAAMLPARIAAAIEQANARLVPARAGWATTEDWDHTFNRRWIRRPDRVFADPFGKMTVRAHMHPGHESPDVTGPSGPVDPGLSVLAIQTREGQPLALLANYSQHYYESPLLSSDYYGRFRKYVGEMLGAGEGFVGIMSQGTSGDLMWMDYGAPRRAIGYDAYAREVAERVVSEVRRIEWREHVPLRMAERELRLRFRVPDAARLAWAQEMVQKLGDRLPESLPEVYALEAFHLQARPEAVLKLQALCIGGLGITALPNEVFALTGLKLKAQSPLQPTFNIELANGAEGYIPSPEQHYLGGYTTWPARTAGLEEQAEPRIVSTLLDLLEEVSGQPRRPLRPIMGPAAQAVRAARPAAYWRLEEVEGRQVSDASGHGQTARLEGGVARYLPGVGSGNGFGASAHLTGSPWSGSAINRCVHLAGGTLVASAQEVSTSQALSVSLWFWNGLPNDARAITAELLHLGPGETLRLGGTNGFAGRLTYPTGPETRLVGATVIGMREWHCVTVVREASHVSVYLDGRLECEGPTGPRPPTATWIFGGGMEVDASFEGKLDEVAVFHRALTAREVAAHFRVGMGREP